MVTLVLFQYTQSARLKEDLLASPLQCVASMSLEPTPVVHFLDSFSPDARACTGQLFDGHADRTVHLTGIPAYCSLAALRSAVRWARVATWRAPDVSRIALSPPRWEEGGGGGGGGALVRSAWVVLPAVRAVEDVDYSLQVGCSAGLLWAVLVWCWY